MCPIRINPNQTHTIIIEVLHITRDFLNRYSGVAREVLEALLDKYMNTGIYEIEKTEVLKLDPFSRYGKPAKIAQAFGGKEGYLKAIHELEETLYNEVG